MKRGKIRYLKRNFDELAIAGILVRLAKKSAGAEYSDDEMSVLAGLRRAMPEFENKTPEEIGAALDELTESQLLGVVGSVKGVLHELDFVQIENSDGDSVTASIFGSTNHPDYDVLLFDGSTSEWSQVQLKATDNRSYVQEWIDEHPEGEILVTEELAEEMELPTSGANNEELTVRVEDFLDRLEESHDPASLADYLVLLTPLSISIACWGICKRWREGKITTAQLKFQLALLSGRKAFKFGAIALLMSIPVVNVVTGVVLLSKLIFTADELSSRSLKVRPSPA